MIQESYKNKILYCDHLNVPNVNFNIPITSNETLIFHPNDDSNNSHHNTEDSNTHTTNSINVENVKVHENN